MDAVLFPLPGLILSPGGKITLNIFEPRYLQMVKDAMAGNLPMAIAHASKTEFADSLNIPDQGYPFICPEVGYGKVEILGESPNGVLIAVSSMGKAHVDKVESFADPYIKLELTPVDLNNELDPQSEFLYRRIRALAKEKLMCFIKSSEEADAIMAQLQSPPKLLAFYIDHILQGWVKKYELFQIDDINEKIARLGEMIVEKENGPTLH